MVSVRWAAGRGLRARPERPAGRGLPCPGPARPSPADRALSPLSRRRALAGSMKKRLLMPSRGKAWGGRGRGRRASPQAVPACAVLSRAWCTAGGSGPAHGAVHAGRAAPRAPPAPRHWAGDPRRPPRATSFPGASGSRVAPALPVPGPWTVRARVAPAPPPACAVRRHAVTARMPSASAPVAARAVPPALLRALPGVRGALGRWPLRWGQIGPRCGRGPGHGPAGVGLPGEGTKAG